MGRRRRRTALELELGPGAAGKRRWNSARGRVKNKSMRVTYICRSPKIKAVTFFSSIFLSRLWAFRKKGVKKTRNTLFFLTQTQKFGGFFPAVFFPLPRLFCSIFFISFLGVS
jgi:hypothetical protein